MYSLPYSYIVKLFLSQAKLYQFYAHNHMIYGVNKDKIFGNLLRFNFAHHLNLFMVTRPQRNISSARLRQVRILFKLHAPMNYRKRQLRLTLNDIQLNLLNIHVPIVKLCSCCDFHCLTKQVHHFIHPLLLPH